LSRGKLCGSFPKNILLTWAKGKLLHNAHDSRHLLAGFPFSLHHIFMQALSKLRCVKTGHSEETSVEAFSFAHQCKLTREERLEESFTHFWGNSWKTVASEEKDKRVGGQQYTLQTSKKTRCGESCGRCWKFG